MMAQTIEQIEAALELANQAKFTPAELQAYEKARDEIRQVLEIAAEREASGFAKGEINARRNTLLRLLSRAGIALTDDDRGRIQACADTATLDRWTDNILGAKTAADVLT